MLLVSVFLVCAFSLCGANLFVCHHYTESSKALEIYCDHYRHLLPKDCSKDAPSMSPTDVLHLKIEGCDQSSIGDASDKYLNIESLDISYSGYQSLNWTGGVFEKVVLLNVSSNELTAVPTTILSKFPKITQLHLADNKLEQISNSDFENVGQELKDIVLTRNILRSIDANAFDNLKQLAKIEVSSNQFSSFLLTNLTNSTVQDIIMLENSELTTINCTFFQAIGSKHVYFTWKYITTFDGSCSEWNFAIDKSGWNALDGIYPNFARHSKIFCSSNFVNCFGNIKNFVAGSGKFENVTDVVKVLSASTLKIDLSGNPVEARGKLEPMNGTVGDEVKLLGPAIDFERFPILRELSLSDTGLNSFSFDSIKSSHLHHLNISKNNIKALDSISRLQHFPELTHFDASENRIENIEEVVGYLPSTIQYLNLAGSPLNRTHALQSFERFTALTHLNLSDTQLPISGEDSFNKLRHLITLDISQNNLKSVDFSSLQSLYQLKEFRASNSQIANIAEIVQHLAPSVEKLDLSENPAAKFDLTSFDRLKSLKELNLSNNNTNTDSEEIDVGQLPSTLERLNLSGNKLKQINNLDRKHFPVLKALDLSNNQLDCDDLKDMRSEFKDGDVSSDKCHKFWIILFTILTIFAIIFFIIFCNLCIMPRMTKEK